MADQPSVEINRTCLSLLFRDNALSEGLQEGFLVGDVIQRAKRISDTEEAGGTRVVIRVTATFPLPKHCRFYSGTGRIDEASLQKILGPFADKIVGYYEFKRNWVPNKDQIATFTVANVMRGLCQLRKSSAENPFVFLKLRQSHDEKHIKSKHIIVNSYTFFTMLDDGSFQKLASTIPNLGDTSHDRYVQNSAVPKVDKLFAEMKKPTKKIDALPIINIHNSMLKQLEEASKKAAALEKRFNEAATSLHETESLISVARMKQADAHALSIAVKSEPLESEAGPSTNLDHSEACVQPPGNSPFSKVNTRPRKRAASGKRC